MANTEMNGMMVETAPSEAVAKREDYRTPKLTVVGTVADLTLGSGNDRTPDGAFQTQQGG